MSFVSMTSQGFKHDKLRRKFSPQEDEIIKKIVDTCGHECWEYIASILPERNPRQVRDRYMNYLSPLMTNLPWTRMEDDILRSKVSQYGNHWVLISSFFQGRSSNNIKNRWHKVLSKGIEPKYEDEEESSISSQSSPANYENDESVIIPIEYPECDEIERMVFNEFGSNYYEMEDDLTFDCMIDNPFVYSI